MFRVSTLAALALKPLIGSLVHALEFVGAEKIVDAVTEKLRAHFHRCSDELSTALNHASERAWAALEHSLAGPGWLDWLTKRGDDRTFAAQLRTFLAANPLATFGKDGSVLRNALLQLRAARKAECIPGKDLDEETLAARTASFARFTDPDRHRDAELGLLANESQRLRSHGFSHLAAIVELRPEGEDTPLLLVAVRFFFEREVLARPLLREWLRDAAIANIRSELRAGLTGLAETLEQHGTILAQVLEFFEEFREGYARLEGKVDRLLDRDLKPGDSGSIRDERERRVVRHLLELFRRLPEGVRQDPELLNQISRLLLASGESGEAQVRFAEAAHFARQRSERAAARYGEYLAALSGLDWASALKAVVEAGMLDAAKYAPFPLHEYVPESILGAGGFGVVFLCKQRSKKHPLVALKALRTDDLDKSTYLEDEASVLEDLEHPSIIRLLRVGWADPERNRPYLVMEYFEGITLEEQVVKHGTLSPDEACEVGRQIAEAMQVAHARHILHRDMKPGNVMVNRRQKPASPGTCLWLVKVIDFGLALQRQAIIETSKDLGAMSATPRGRSIVGTLDYASPEQMGRGGSVTVDERSDIFGFGRTICFTLFGTHDPDREDWEALKPHNPTLFNLLASCISNHSAKRPKSFSEVLERLPKRDAEEAKNCKGAQVEEREPDATKYEAPTETHRQEGVENEHLTGTQEEQRIAKDRKSLEESERLQQQDKKAHDERAGLLSEEREARKRVQLEADASAKRKKVEALNHTDPSKVQQTPRGKRLPTLFDALESVDRVKVVGPKNHRENTANSEKGSGLLNWPALNDYLDALQHPGRALYMFEDLRESEIESNHLRKPKGRAGSSAIVYKVTGTRGPVAVRVFRKPESDRQRRYEALAVHLTRKQNPFTVRFDYHAEGIFVSCNGRKGEYFPLLLMEWVKGETLGKWVNDRVLKNDTASLRNAADKFITMIESLQKMEIAHGDLQHGNIMVAYDHLKLVDYDCMYVPELRGAEQIESSHPAYQHRERPQQKLGPNLDNFSAWIILISLRALAADPTLHTRYKKRANTSAEHENLLFTVEDLHESNSPQAPIWADLLKSPDLEVRVWSSNLRGCLDNVFGAIPPFIFGQSRRGGERADELKPQVSNQNERKANEKADPQDQVNERQIHAEVEQRISQGRKLREESEQREQRERKARDEREQRLAKERVTRERTEEQETPFSRLSAGLATLPDILALQKTKEGNALLEQYSDVIWPMILEACLTDYRLAGDYRAILLKEPHLQDLRDIAAHALATEEFPRWERHWELLRHITAGNEKEQFKKLVEDSKLNEHSSLQVRALIRRTWLPFIQSESLPWRKLIRPESSAELERIVQGEPDNPLGWKAVAIYSALFVGGMTEKVRGCLESADTTLFELVFKLGKKYLRDSIHQFVAVLASDPPSINLLDRLLTTGTEYIDAPTWVVLFEKLRENQCDSWEAFWLQRERLAQLLALLNDHPDSRRLSEHYVRIVVYKVQQKAFPHEHLPLNVFCQLVRGLELLIARLDGNEPVHTFDCKEIAWLQRIRVTLALDFPVSTHKYIDAIPLLTTILNRKALVWACKHWKDNNDGSPIEPLRAVFSGKLYPGGIAYDQLMPNNLEHKQQLNLFFGQIFLRFYSLEDQDEIAIALEAWCKIIRDCKRGVQAALQNYFIRAINVTVAERYDLFIRCQRLLMPNVAHEIVTDWECLQKKRSDNEDEFELVLEKPSSENAVNFDDMDLENEPLADKDSSSSHWYYEHDKQCYGPVSMDQMKRLARNGLLLPSDLVCPAGKQQWQVASKVADLDFTV